MRRTALEHLQTRATDTAVPRVSVVSPQHGSPTQSLTLPGQIEAWNEAQIFGQVSGYVKNWFKDYGAGVSAGEVLASIETPTLDAQYQQSLAKLRVAEAQYNIAALTASRYNQLTGTADIAQQQIDDKNATALAAKADVAAAQQEVDNYKAKLGFKDLKAPFGGIVTARRINVGDYIDGGGGQSTANKQELPPYAVADIHKLRVFVSVPQAFARILKPGLTAEVRLPGGTAAAVPVKFLTQAGKVVQSTRTIVTEFEIEHPDGMLVPGAFVDVTMIFPNDPGILVVPFAGTSVPVGRHAGGGSRRGRSRAPAEGDARAQFGPDRAGDVWPEADGQDRLRSVAGPSGRSVREGRSGCGRLPERAEAFGFSDSGTFVEDVNCDALGDHHADRRQAPSVPP